MAFKVRIDFKFLLIIFSHADSFQLKKIQAERILYNLHLNSQNLCNPTQFKKSRGFIQPFNGISISKR